VNSSPQLPIIDIGAFSQGTQQRAATTQAVTDALTQSGFMYITGHDIDAMLIERAFAAMRWFFGQPREFKVRYAYSDIDANFGYQRIETERLDPGSMPDLKESFTMRNALERADETARWPEGEFRDVALALYAAGLGAAYRVMEVLAAGLELPAGFFARRHRGENVTLRFLHYPAGLLPRSSAQLGAGAHTDYGSITLLFQDEVGGLELLGADRTWQQAPPVQGAAVTSGTSSASTDENGVFNFSDISMSSRFGYVKVVKQGYFTGSRSILTNAASSNYVTITLIPRTSKGSFAASSGGTVVVQTGDTVAFDASSVVNAATNVAYTGTVHVYAAYLDPMANDRSEQMPGDLRGIDSTGKETMLQSFGMMVVELEGDGGEKLQIAPGKVANISMKIPDALKTGAAATIPLWYFNDTTGRWIEQGTAVRKDGQYCGQTSHFSWWNFDAPVGAVNFKVRLKDQHGNPLTYTRVDLISPTFGRGSAFTDAAGYASGLIPKGEILQLRVISLCGSELAGANIGPALADQDLRHADADRIGPHQYLARAWARRRQLDRHALDRKQRGLAHSAP